MIKKRRRRRGKGKGGSFEREVCKQLSLWWTYGKRDDVFWRTSQSGGRATTRAKKGCRTFGQVGDVCATDPKGVRLLKLVTIELKNGYQKESMATSIDRASTKGMTLWMRWILKAKKEHQEAKSFAWIIIHRRKGRRTMVYVPRRMMARFDSLRLAMPSLIGDIKIGEMSYEIHSFPFSEFLRLLDPEEVKRGL